MPLKLFGTLCKGLISKPYDLIHNTILNKWVLLMDLQVFVIQRFKKESYLVHVNFQLFKLRNFQ